MEFSAQQIAEFLKGEVVGNKDIKVSDFAKIEEGRSGTLTFLANPKYTHYIYETHADIVIVNKTFEPEHAISATLIKVDDAYQSVAQLFTLVNNLKPRKTGISAKADIAQSASIGKDIFVGAFVSIGENCKIGNNVTIHPNTQIGDNVSVGDGSIIYSNVSIYSDCVVGKNNIIHSWQEDSGAVIGADGFGFAPDEEGHYHKIPQIGNVVLGDDVEIGANTTIDRATMGATHISDGVKIDNLVQVAHNVDVGEYTAIAAQTGIAGSTKVGRRCIFGGQVGITGHISIADGTILGAQTGVSGNINEGGKVWAGSPVLPIDTFRRASVLIRKLPDIVHTVYDLEKKLQE